MTLKQNASHLVPDNFLSSYNGHVSKSTPSPECCYDCGQGAVVCLRVISIWWLPQVHAGCELSGKLYPKIWYHAHEGSWGQCQCFPRQSRLPTPSSVTIRITGTYNPDTGVGTVSCVPSEDWLQGVTSSASQTSGVGVAVAQAFLRNVDFVRQRNTLGIAFSDSTNTDHRKGGLPVSTNCVNFSCYSNLENGRMWHPTSIGIPQNCRTL